MTPPEMPGLMRELHALEFDYQDGDGIDFEPFDEFLSSEETDHWIRAWTGNDSIDGSDYLVFGQDGTGGHAAFWCVRADADLLGQPIVFFGSEGSVGVVASTFSEYVWLLAGGFGPYEAVECSKDTRPANPGFVAFATRHFGASPISVSEVLARAGTGFPTFVEHVRSLCA